MQAATSKSSLYRKKKANEQLLLKLKSLNLNEIQTSSVLNLIDENREQNLDFNSVQPLNKKSRLDSHECMQQIANNATNSSFVQSNSFEDENSNHANFPTANEPDSNDSPSNDDIGAPNFDFDDDDFENPSSFVPSAPLEDFEAAQKEKLYQGAPVTTLEFMMLFYTLMTNSNLNGTQLKVVLAFTTSILPPDSKVPTNINEITNFFSFHGLERNYYCTTCSTICPTDLNSRKKPCCPQCQQKLQDFFLTRSIVKCFSVLFDNMQTFQDSEHYRKEYKEIDGVIQDIYDGDSYKKCCKPITEKEGGYSLKLSTDGVSPFNNGQTQLWPLYAVVNELAKLKRFRTENMLFVGCWTGHDPNFNFYLTRLVDEIIELRTKSTLIQVANSEKKIELKVCLGPICTDLGAKYKVFAMMAFNGHYGCGMCCNKGVKEDKRAFYFFFREKNYSEK